MRCELSGCCACGGRTLPMHLVRSEAYEVFCDNCGEECPMCGADGRDCEPCEDTPGVKLTQYGTVELERKEAEIRYARAEVEREMKEGR